MICCYICEYFIRDTMFLDCFFFLYDHNETMEKHSLCKILAVYQEWIWFSSICAYEIFLLSSQYVRGTDKISIKHHFLYKPMSTFEHNVYTIPILTQWNWMKSVFLELMLISMSLSIYIPAADSDSAYISGKMSALLFTLPCFEICLTLFY